MKIWLTTYDDGDYYCEGNHLIGVFDNEEMAKKAVEEWKATSKYAGGYQYNVSEWELNKVELFS